jgi:hypothetical protein
MKLDVRSFKLITSSFATALSTRDKLLTLLLFMPTGSSRTTTDPLRCSTGKVNIPLSSVVVQAHPCQKPDSRTQLTREYYHCMHTVPVQNV